MTVRTKLHVKGVQAAGGREKWTKRKGIAFLSVRANARSQNNFHLQTFKKNLTIFTNKFLILSDSK